MKTIVITMEGHQHSEAVSKAVRERWTDVTGWEATIWKATTPATLDAAVERYPVTWLPGRTTSDGHHQRYSRRSCSMSHLRAWDSLTEPTVILEHDAWVHTDPREFISEFLASDYGGASLQLPHQNDVISGEGMIPYTRLMGAAVVVKPTYARHLVDIALKHGYMINDKHTNGKRNPHLDVSGLCGHHTGFVTQGVPGYADHSTSSEWTRGL